MFKGLFNKKRKGKNWTQFHLNASSEEKELIKKFTDKKDDDRIKDTMILGDTGSPKVFRILQYAILFDPNKNVKFAALKRIHNFKSQPDLLLMLNKMHQGKLGDKMEPYFSMALSRVGIISNEEFEMKMNNSDSNK